MLELKLFGTGQARYYDHPLEGFPNQQAFLILCYLLIHKGQPQLRERLAAVFWGNYPTLTARKYLRNTLWRLRQNFEAAGIETSHYLSTNEENIAFIHTAPYWLDVETFETITSHYQALKGENLLQEQATELARGVELYTGDLLENVYEDWCLYDRERLRMAYLEALTKLLAFHTAHRSYEQGLKYGEQLLELDTMQESVHRQMMILHWRSGNHTAALAQYKRCAQILQEEIQSQPMEETRLLYEKMLHGQFEPERLLPKKVPPKNSAHLNTSLDIALQRLDNLQERVNQMTEEIHLLQKLICQAMSDKQD